VIKKRLPLVTRIGVRFTARVLECRLFILFTLVRQIGIHYTYFLGVVNDLNTEILN
jgi:hypothetical protein